MSERLASLIASTAASSVLRDAQIAHDHVDDLIAAGAIDDVLRLLAKLASDLNVTFSAESPQHAIWLRVVEPRLAPTANALPVVIVQSALEASLGLPRPTRW